MSSDPIDWDAEQIAAMLTDEERAAIRALKKLTRRWPKTLWLFSASGTLHVMRCDADGKRAVTDSTMGDGGVDPDYSVTTVKIPNDGGDW
jgi:hypothetical protein